MNEPTPLERAGFQTVSVQEFLNLSPEESAWIELRLSLSRELRTRRERSHLTQTALAERLGSSQSRIAKAERGHHGVSLDLMIRALLATGATQADIARAIAP